VWTSEPPAVDAAPALTVLVDHSLPVLCSFSIESNALRLNSIECHPRFAPTCRCHPGPVGRATQLGHYRSLLADTIVAGAVVFAIVEVLRPAVRPSSAFSDAGLAGPVSTARRWRGDAGVITDLTAGLVATGSFWPARPPRTTRPSPLGAGTDAERLPSCVPQLLVRDFGASQIKGRAVKGRPQAERGHVASAASEVPERPLTARSVTEATMSQEARQGFLGAPWLAGLGFVRRPPPVVGITGSARCATRHPRNRRRPQHPGRLSRK
jgi:hypothetical protein